MKWDLFRFLFRDGGSRLYLGNVGEAERKRREPCLRFFWITPCKYCIYEA